MNKAIQVTVLSRDFSDKKYRMEGNFGGCKLWRIGKENFIGRINFGELITKA